MVNGSIAYAAQQAWCFNATLKDNILFGRDYDEEKYENVLWACSLRQDLEILPHGDQTEVWRGWEREGGTWEGVHGSGGLAACVRILKYCITILTSTRFTHNNRLVNMVPFWYFFLGSQM